MFPVWGFSYVVVVSTINIERMVKSILYAYITQACTKSLAAKGPYKSCVIINYICDPA